MTNSKVRNSDSAYSIYFSQVLLKLFTFLINTADNEIYNIFNSFLFPYYFNTNRTNKQTNKQTHKHKLSFNNKDEYSPYIIWTFNPEAHMDYYQITGHYILLAKIVPSSNHWSVKCMFIRIVLSVPSLNVIPSHYYCISVNPL